MWWVYQLYELEGLGEYRQVASRPTPTQDFKPAKFNPPFILMSFPVRFYQRNLPLRRRRVDVFRDLRRDNLER